MEAKMLDRGTAVKELRNIMYRKFLKELPGGEKGFKTYFMAKCGNC